MVHNAIQHPKGKKMVHIAIQHPKHPPCPIKNQRKRNMKYMDVRGINTLGKKMVHIAIQHPKRPTYIWHGRMSGIA